MRSVWLWGTGLIFLLASGAASAQNLADCGPMRVPWSIPEHRVDGDYVLTLTKQADGSYAGKISEFTSSASTSSPNGAVDDLSVDGNSVSYRSQTGFTYDVTITDCKVTALSGYGNHPQAGRLNLALDR